MYARYRIPGIQFDASTPPPADAPPRMDVAVFVGFAATGPMHRAVAVEDVTAFAVVFGGTTPLAYDTERGATAWAAMAPAVRAFFSNGGRRCWVIRVGWTRPLRDAWGASIHHTPYATARRVALPGLLALGDDGLHLAPAVAEARSLGSWADTLRARTRAERLAFPLGVVAQDAAAIRFAAPQGLGTGEVVEFVAANGVVAYARTDALTGGIATASPLANFRRLTAEEPVDHGNAMLVGRGDRSAAFAIDSENVAHVTYSAGRRPKGARVGGWVRWHDAHRDILIAIDTIDGDAIAGRAWQRLAAKIPSGVLLAARLRFGLRVEAARGAPVDSVFGLAPGGEAAWWRNLPDDRHYADPAATAAVRPPLSVDTAAPPTLAWLPLGLDDAWSVAADPIRAPRTPLERDGLARYDERLFLDPALANLGLATLADEATRVREVEGRALFGLHGAFAVSGYASDGDATLIAVPDAVQPGWRRRPSEPLPAQPPPVAEPPATWLGHRGACPPAVDPSITAPDTSRFLDCSTRALATPVLTPFTEAQPVGTLVLHWTASSPNARYTLKEATEADLSDAEPIWTGTDLSTRVAVPRAGTYRYRLSATDGEDVSAASAIAVAVVDRAWVQTRPEAFDAFEYDTLTKLHRATLHVAAASGELFAMLALPQHFRTDAAVRHANHLQALATDPAQQRALSFGAIYHPWLVTPSGDVDAPELIAFPPDGAAAGIAAARALARGAWIAPANVVIRDIVALSGPLADTDRQAIGEAGLNLVRRDARGFLVLEAQTLSTEPEWRQINVRRLMSLLRRTALRRGQRYVFEPNGDVLRRAVERGFSQMLDELFRRGAFAGNGRDDSFRLAVNPTSQDRDAGRLIVDIGVAPAQPMRFLTVRLVQGGERFSVAEER